MDEDRAHRVVAALRSRGVLAQVERAGVYQFGVRVRLDGDRVAIWDTDGTASLEAQVMRNGVLVNFVPSIPGSAHASHCPVHVSLQHTPSAQFPESHSVAFVHASPREDEKVHP